MSFSRMLKLLILGVLPIASLVAHAEQVSLTTGINTVQFGSAAEQAFLGSGFVIEHQGRLYGVTAKHVLLMRAGGPPANTDVQSEISHWRLRDPRSDAQLAFGRLLNGDEHEAVNEDVLKRDTLLFDLPAAGDFKPLRLAARDPEPGERLHAVGCSYDTEATCAQDHYTGVLLERQGHNLLIDLGSQDLQAMFGLSGAPLLNESGELVGIVSNVLPDAAGNPRFAPVDTAYLQELLRRQSAKSRLPG
jgi:hypothetical protein